MCITMLMILYRSLIETCSTQIRLANQRYLRESHLCDYMTCDVHDAAQVLRRRALRRVKIIT